MNYCFECGEYYDETLTITQNGRQVCSHCLAHFYSECGTCDEFIRSGYSCRRCNIHCGYCGNSCPRATAIDSPNGLICVRCREQYYRECSECGNIYQRGYNCRNCNPAYCHYCDRHVPEVFSNGDGDWYCQPCLDDSFTQCDECGSYRENRFSRCQNCYPAHTIHSYSYRPNPIFNGNGPLYLGMELEIAIPYRHFDRAVEIACTDLGKNGYLKEDSSIGTGFEIVTHPMSYEWAMENFPWQMLGELENIGCEAEESCGLHVHLSRDGFSSPSHLFRWMKFIYRNPREVQKIARRESRKWARFDDDERRDIKNLAKGKMGATRYCAINTQNSNTLEMRVFASSLSQQEVKAALALAESSVEYTRKLSTEKIIKNGAWEWEKFAEWINEHPEYLPLNNEIKEKTPCVF